MMAKYTTKPDGYFDSHWRDRLALGEKVLREVQSSWLLDGSLFPTELVAAILCWIFRFDFYVAEFIDYAGVQPSELHRLTLDSWRNLVQTPQRELRLLNSNANNSQLQLGMQILQTTINDAATCWMNNVHSPSTDNVVRNCTRDLRSTKSLGSINRNGKEQMRDNKNSIQVAVDRFPDINVP